MTLSRGRRLQGAVRRAASGERRGEAISDPIDYILVVQKVILLISHTPISTWKGFHAMPSSSKKMMMAMTAPTLAIQTEGRWRGWAGAGWAGWTKIT